MKPTTAWKDALTRENIETAVRQIANETEYGRKTALISDVYRVLGVPKTARNQQTNSQIISRTFREMGLTPLSKRGEKRRRYLIPENYCT